MKLIKWFPIALVTIAVAFNAVMLWPELTISRHPLNDHVMHYAATLAMAASLTPDSYWNGCCMGSAFWQSYPPLPHYMTALMMRALPRVDPQSVFLALDWLLLCSLPLGMWALARSIGLRPLAAALAAVLFILPAEGGEFGRFGISYGAYVWRGSGLYAQLWGFALGLPVLAYLLRALRRGRGLWLAGVLVALLVVTHVVVAYILVATAVLLCALGYRDPWHDLPERSKEDVDPWKCREQPPIKYPPVYLPTRKQLAWRLAHVGAVSLTLTLWYFVPLAVNWRWMGGGHWSEVWRVNSFGATGILTAISNGSLLDGPRLPVMTLLMAAGALLAWRSRDRVGRSLLWLTAFWLVAWWGPTTWGRIPQLAGMVQALQPHRFQLAFEMGAVLLAAFALGHMVQWVAGERL